MLHIAYLMLTRNRSKCLGIVFGLTFTSFIMTQQPGIFLGNLQWTYGLITDIGAPDIWVMHPKIQFLDDPKPIPDTSLYRVTGIEGVMWAKPLFKGITQAKLSNGAFQTCRIIGIDDVTFIGAPGIMIRGNVGSLRQASAIIVDEEGANNKLSTPGKNPGSPNIPLQLGQSFEVNNNRIVVVGIAKVTPTFQSYPTIFTSYSNAIRYAPSQINLLSFILVKAKPGENLKKLCDLITRRTGLKAYTKEEFRSLTIWYYLKNTGILLNFGASILLAFLMGGIITGQIFYNFTLENLPYYGLLKAIGVSKNVLVNMILFQAFVVSLIGYGIGLGLTSFVVFFTYGTMITFAFPLYIFFLSIVGILAISFFAASITIRKLILIEPAIVFKNE